MADIDLLKNRGLFRLGPTETQDDCTYIVVGLGRSGTSILAGALRNLGLFMGDGASEKPSNEDDNLRAPILRGDWDSALTIIEKYNEDNTKWGVKIPHLIHYLDKAHTTFRNPKYIVIFRDIFSIANRDRISMQADLVSSMSLSILGYEKIVSFLKTYNPAALLISFERALHEKDALIKELIDFCDLQPSAQQIANAKSFIRNDPEDYLNLSRITHSEGYLRPMTGSSLTGWAKYIGSERPATVILYASGIEIARTVANKFREDLMNAGIHSMGTCGFDFILPEDVLRTSSAITVRVEGDIEDLPFEC